LAREQQRIDGAVAIAIERVGGEREPLFRITVRVRNSTSSDDAATTQTRDQAVLRSLASTHVILAAHNGGEFVSLLDPPERWKDAAAACKNVGAWPVLVGEAPARDTVLASPIILYDYPQIAP